MRHYIYVAAALAAGRAFALAPEDVNIFTGTSGDGHTHPAAVCPFALVQAGPDTGRGTWAYCSGYRYEDKCVEMFSQTHLNGTGCPDLGDLGIKPLTDAELVKSRERAAPGFYAVRLADTIDVEIAAAPHSAIYRLDFGAAGDAKILIDIDYGLGNLETDTWAIKRVTDAAMEFGGDGRVLEGSFVREGWIPHRFVAFSLEFDREPAKVERVSERQAIVSFASREVLLKLALSTKSIAGAKGNLAHEIPDWNFDGVKERARAQWAELLGRVDVVADGERRANLATALYHLFLQPNNIADWPDTLYSGFSLWDTARAAHPLYTMLVPERVGGFVSSMIAHHREHGFLPLNAHWGKETQCMIGTHAVAAIADAYLKGFRDFDAEAAYDAVHETLLTSHPDRLKESWDVLDRYGYYPCDIILYEGASRTLEEAFDAECAARFARALGKAADVPRYERRAGAWKNLFDRETLFMRGKDSKGRWREDFDPLLLGHETDWPADFTEGNAWQWTWSVLHGAPGLVEAFGSRDAFTAKLDAMFAMSSDCVGDVGDVSGMIGQFVQGNEPSHHVPYLYQFAGRPEKTAEWMRTICDTFFHPAPDGMPGNEDCGEMSAWYVFACLGFYPVDPCGGDYVIGAPQVEKTVLHLAGGRTFTVVAENLSAENRYVRSVKLNGVPLDGFIIRHEDIMRGGTLVFEMVPEQGSASL